MLASRHVFTSVFCLYAITHSESLSIRGIQGSSLGITKDFPCHSLQCKAQDHEQSYNHGTKKSNNAIENKVIKHAYRSISFASGPVCSLFIIFFAEHLLIFPPSSSDMKLFPRSDVHLIPSFSTEHDCKALKRRAEKGKEKKKAEKDEIEKVTISEFITETVKETFTVHLNTTIFSTVTSTVNNTIHHTMLTTTTVQNTPTLARIAPTLVPTASREGPSATLAGGLASSTATGPTLPALASQDHHLRSTEVLGIVLGSVAFAGTLVAGVLFGRRLYRKYRGERVARKQAQTEGREDYCSRGKTAEVWAEIPPAYAERA